MVVSFSVVNGLAVGVADCWFLAAPVGLAFDDQLVGGGGEPVDGGLGEQRVGHHGQPFLGCAVGGEHGRGALVAFDAELVEVGGLGGVQRLEREVIDLSGVDHVQLIVIAGGDVADASVTSQSGLESVLLQDAAEPEEFPVGGGEPLLKVLRDGAFLAKLGGKDVDDAFPGVGDFGPGRARWTVSSLLGAQRFDAVAQVGAGVEEVDADSSRPGDGPEVDLLLVLDELADRGFCASRGGLTLGLSGAA
jgi:hypothetical protein